MGKISEILKVCEVGMPGSCSLRNMILICGFDFEFGKYGETFYKLAPSGDISL